MSEHRKGRPTGSETTPQPNPESSRHATARADVALRVAWLRVQAERMYSVDPGGQLSAQLYDFAHLLEDLDSEGRWDQ